MHYKQTIRSKLGFRQHPERERAHGQQGILSKILSIQRIRNNGGERPWTEMFTEPNKQEQNTQKYNPAKHPKSKEKIQ